MIASRSKQPIGVTMEILGKHIFEIAKEMQSPRKGVLSGFPDLDSKTLGFKGGELTLIAGRPSMGKTALLLQMAHQTGGTVMIASLEMNERMLGERLISQISGVGLHTIKSKRIKEKDKVLAREALEKISNKQIYVLDTPALTPPRLEMALKEVNPSCVFVDYLQLMSIAGERGEEKVALIGQALKAMALKLDIPFVVASQLNRNPEGREGHVPYLSDLRGSGSLEQTADVVLLLHRPAYYRIMEGDPDADDDGQAWLYVAKNRSGPVGKIEFKWDKTCMSFTERSAKFREFGSPS